MSTGGGDFFVADRLCMSVLGLPIAGQPGCRLLGSTGEKLPDWTYRRVADDGVIERPCPNPDVV